MTSTQPAIVTPNLSLVPGTVNNARAVKLGPFFGGLHNTPGAGEQILDSELFQLTNLEVDYDGTLANRPEVRYFTTSGESKTTQITLIGTYLPIDGRKMLVVHLPEINQVALVDASTGAFYTATYSSSLKSVACIQYANKMWVVATNDSPDVGGYFDAPTGSTFTWTQVPSMPRGEAITIYRERLWIAHGKGATSDTSRFYFSPVGPTTGVVWNTGTDFFDVVPGNGQKLVALLRIGNDLILLKEHSTHRFTYTVDPRKSEMVELDSTIGIPDITCYALYKTNVLYVLHDNGIYEMYQYTYNKISSNLNMIKQTDPSIYAKDQFGVSLFRERLFVRYYTRIYVYAVELKVWSEWVTDRKFSRVKFIPSDTTGEGVAYATTASSDNPNKMYTMIDDRRTLATGTTVVSGPPQYINTNNTPEGTGTSCYFNTPTGASKDDWLYVVIVLSKDTTATIVTPADAVWETILPMTSNGTATRGVDIQIWRTRHVMSKTQYTFTFNKSIAYQGLITAIRGGDTNVEVSAVQYQDANTAGTVKAPATVVEDKSMVLTFFGIDFTTSVSRNFTCYDVPAGLGQSPLGAAYSYAFAGATTYNDATKPSQTVNVNLNWTPLPDTASVAAVNVYIHPVRTLDNPNNEVFKGYLTTKTYDFEIPHTFKVMFWWGVNVATSGNFTAEIVIPQTSQGLTWRQAQTLYNTYQNAQINKISWGGSSDVDIQDTVAPSLGKYARKFIKLLKKVRFRTAYYKFTFDVVTNGGIADASLRVYNAYVYIKSKETISKKTS